MVQLAWGIIAVNVSPGRIRAQSARVRACSVCGWLSFKTLQLTCRYFQTLTPAVCTASCKEWPIALHKITVLQLCS